jgi:hypothetical protein
MKVVMKSLGLCSRLRRFEIGNVAKNIELSLGQTTMNAAVRLQIIRQYGHVLESLRGLVGDEAELPCAKEVIEEALLEEIALTNDAERHRVLANGYVLLATFVSTEECAVSQRFEAWLRELGKGGQIPREFPDPDSLRLTEIEGRINRAMKLRLAELRERERNRLNHSRVRHQFGS